MWGTFAAMLINTKFYKVIFKDNVPDSAIFMGYSFCGSVQLERAAGKRIIKSFAIIADSEEESIDIARRIMKDLAIV
jgi:hypothetical protein